ncbi:MAG: MFS transporter [Candidatus Lokiarchaeota archaeon]|nr:MFS transporter [Candidatus Lokiarchaeota archaeon]
MAEITTEEKFKVSLAFFIGCGLFTTQIAWSMYNTQVNQMLFIYLGSFALVGVLMAMDNIIGIIIQPVMGNVSDNTRTKLGRRIPYLIVGIPISAVLFALIGGINPNTDPLWLLILWLVLFVTTMAFYRSQTLSLLGDFIQPVHRSKGNAIVNIMGGIGTGIAFILPALLGSVQLAFLTVSIMMVISLIVILLTVKEKNSFSYQRILSYESLERQKVKQADDKLGLIESFKEIWKEDDKSTFFMLFAILALFIGYAGLEALFTVYAKEVLGLSELQAPLILGLLLLAFLIIAFPAGILATKVGRRLTIKVGLVIVIASLTIGYLIQTVLVISIMFFIAGIGWAFININTLVIIMQMAKTEKQIGTYTGVYLTFSYLAQILGPVLVGMLADLLGYNTLLIDSTLFFVLALVFMFFVKKGEVDSSFQEAPSSSDISV